MFPFNLKCLLVGHDDRIRRNGARVYLNCSECGRETPGWDLTVKKTAAPSLSAEDTPHGLRWIFSHMLRGHFRPVGLH